MRLETEPQTQPLDIPKMAARALVAQLEREHRSQSLRQVQLRDLLGRVVLSFPRLKPFWLTITVEVIALIDEKAGIELPSEAKAQLMVARAKQGMVCPNRTIGWLGKYFSFNSLNSYVCQSLTVTSRGQFIVGAVALDRFSAGRTRGGTVAVFVSPDTIIDDSTLANPNVTILRVSWTVVARLMGHC